MSYVTADLRREVITRAGQCCEYCRIGQADRALPFEVDHIIAEKHKGKTIASNLCLACYDCNGFKGSDISSIDGETLQLTPLYNPRIKRWEDHFRVNEVGVIQGITPEGRVTVELLQFNRSERIELRSLLIRLGRYPCRLPLLQQ